MKLSTVPNDPITSSCELRKEMYIKRKHKIRLEVMITANKAKDPRSIFLYVKNMRMCIRPYFYSKKWRPFFDVTIPMQENMLICTNSSLMTMSLWQWTLGCHHSCLIVCYEQGTWELNCLLPLVCVSYSSAKGGCLFKFLSLIYFIKLTKLICQIKKIRPKILMITFELWLFHLVVLYIMCHFIFKKV